MLKKITRARMVKYGVIGASASLLAIAVVAALPNASAAPTSGAGPVPYQADGKPVVNTSVLKSHPNAVRATGPMPVIGRRGPVFQAPPKNSAGAGTVTPRIVNGFTANPADYPYVVGIETFFQAPDPNTGKIVPWLATCTGTVISSTKVLTAGHCAIDLPEGRSFVIAGRSQLGVDSGGQVTGVISTWTDPAFNALATKEAPHEDVAVLTVSPPLASSYTPVTLQPQGNQGPYHQSVWAQIVGYGITSSDATDAGTLRAGTVPITDDATCAATFGSLYDATRMTCAGAPSTGAATCNGDSGGPLVVNGVEVGLTDWGFDPCGNTYDVYERLSRYSDEINVDVARTPPVNLDWTGDGHADLIGRDPNGNLFLYSGSGFANGGFPAIDGKFAFNSGWNIYSKIFRVTNWNGDGLESIFAETSNGNLYRYDADRSDPTKPGLLMPRVLIGNGWNAFADIMITNNWTGDGHPNLMGRTRNGDLVLYTSDGHGGWLNPNGTLIGTGWNGFDTVTTPGDWYGNGHQSLIGRTPHGELVIYNSDGAGGWTNPNGTLIGTGWNGFRLFMSPGDFNGDDMIDVIGVTPKGAMYLYTTDGHGNWQTGNGVAIGAGWQSFNPIF